MSVRAYCRIPEKKKNTQRSKEGSSPQLLYDLLSELEGCREIKIAAYLFNNPIYLEKLIQLASEGTAIQITTLPLLGYSNKKLKVDGFEEKISARELAEEAFKQLDKTKGISLSFFPHQYIWYGARYAGGGASYSFHIKAILATSATNKDKCILTSGNFLCTDPYHSDNMLVIEEEEPYKSTFINFFKDLKKKSIPSSRFYKEFTSYTEEFMVSYSGEESSLDANKHRQCFFTAPFINYGEMGSNHFAVNELIKIIMKAKRRIWVCAQHFHDITPFDGERDSLIGALYRKYQKNKTVKMRFLKQVTYRSLSSKDRAARAEMLFSMVMGAEQRINRLVHDKFIIVDNTLIVSTANYTASQFAYGVRKMDYLDENKVKHRKVDNFSEVNAFVVLPAANNLILDQYIEHFNNLWDTGETIETRL
jgi:hypothetical protein